MSGSPYCIHGYVVDEHLGSKAGLAAAREALAARNLRLLLDCVPNHVAPDHPWVTQHSDYFVQGSEEDLARDPASFLLAADGVDLAQGRDPYFPAWPDTVQLNAFSPGLLRPPATLKKIAAQCDGVRCDMAMLLLNSVFERTGENGRARVPSLGILARRALRGRYGASFPRPLIAEAYWDLEWGLQQQGFDFCYDKRLSTAWFTKTPDACPRPLDRQHEIPRPLIRFLENHDEPRSDDLPDAKGRAAAIVIMTTPGAKLPMRSHLAGARVKLPVHLGRRPPEPVNLQMRASMAACFAW